VLRYRPDLDCFDAERLSLVTELRHAIDDDQLVLHYQPQRDLNAERVTAAEALLRWQHPTRGLLYPATFLDLAEQTDLINGLTSWVLRRALSDLRSLDAGGELCVAVNVSARNLGASGFAADVTGALRETGIAPGRLILEVTETAMMTDPVRAATVLRQVAEAGVSISLDDFGRGQTSLSYLSQLPLHELKIDRSFVGDMLDDAAHAAIVRSVIDLGHNLGLRVVAEGVETETTLSALSEARCDVAQGFLLGRPMPREQFRETVIRPRRELPARAPAPAPARVSHV
jgi:EAL domain-containing protein (putative c-di-GMP-specific phosphodiesterase class I)